MKHFRKSILTLLALTLFGGAGAWAQTEENIFQYCYDCQRNPAYPKTTASASLSDFADPLVGYKGSGFGMGNTSAGPWKLEYVGLWSTTDKHGIEDFRVSIYQETYNCTDVPVFRLYQWNATANEYQHAAYGVVCAYAKVSNAVEHTAFFEAADGWGCVLTNSSHSSSMNITFDEDLTTGLTTLTAAAGSPAIELTKSGANQWSLGQTPDYDLELQVEYYEAHALKNIPAGWQVMVNGVDKTSAIEGDSLMITETDSVTLIPDNPRRVKSVTLEEPLQSINVSGHKIYYSSGETWEEAIKNHPENTGWYTEGSSVFFDDAGILGYDDFPYNDVGKGDEIDPNRPCSLGA